MGDKRKKMGFDFVWEENIELEQNLAPIVNPAGPFEHNIMRDQIQNFEQRFIIREHRFYLRNLAQPAYEAVVKERMEREVAGENSHLLFLFGLFGTINV